jgi:hypothetical protein
MTALPDDLEARAFESTYSLKMLNAWQFTHSGCQNLNLTNLLSSGQLLHNRQIILNSRFDILKSFLLCLALRPTPWKPRA